MPGPQGVQLQEVKKKQWFEADVGITIPNGNQRVLRDLSGFPLPGIYPWKRCRLLCWGCSSDMRIEVCKGKAGLI